MTSTADLIEEARARLLSGQEERANRLDGAITNGALSLALKYEAKGVSDGTVLGVDLEEIRVWEMSAKSMTVIERGVNGSAPAAHSDLAFVAVSPKFSRFRILRAFNEELAALSSPLNGLYQMRPVEVTYNASKAGYDLAGVTSIDDVYKVEAKVTGLSGDWEPVGGWRIDRNANTTDFPSGFALFGVAGQQGQALRIWYRQQFSALSTTDITVDVNTTSGLPASANDLLPLGALIRLVPPRDIKRTFSESQGDTRRAQEVPVNAATQSISGLAKFRQQRINEEAARLARLYPPRSRAA